MTNQILGACEGGNQCSGSPIGLQREMTVGEYLDSQIKAARENVERQCVKRAKAEALNLLDYPFSLINQLTW